MSVRDPAVAGTFYPADPAELKQAIRRAYSHDLGPRENDVRASRCVVCPHAGYYYSAHVACHSIRALVASKATGPVILIGPEHSSAHNGASISAARSWRTPLGDAVIDSRASEMLAELCDAVIMDDAAHEGEHSVEVQIPLLQDAFGDELRIVPVVLSDQDLETAKSVGHAAASVAARFDGLVVASSDLTHYEPDHDARRKDAALIDCVTRLDTGSLYETLRSLRVTACGYGAIAAAMVTALEMGATSGQELAYATSGDVEADSRDSVVGYASVAFS